MRYIDLEYDADSRRLQLTTDLAGTSVDDRSTVFRMGDWESYPDADLDIVYGVIVRRPDTVVGYTFSRLENGETPVPQDVLRACVGGNLPVSLRITYHSDGRIESSLPLVLSVASIPDPVESVHGTGDLVMTRQSGWEWMPALTYSKGAVAVWGFQIWMSRTDGNLGNEPGKTEEWIELTPYIANLFRYKGNVTNAVLDSVTPREMGDTYNITDEGRFPKGCNVTWSGTDWDNLSVHVDTELDASSTNPVQNRVVTEELAGKQTLIGECEIALSPLNWTDGKQIVDHPFFADDTRSYRCSWSEETELEAWKADVRLSSVSSGQAAFSAETAPASIVKLKILKLETVKE